MISPITTNARLVEEYFKRLTEDAESTLQLFTDDAVVYEPFSNEDGIKGKEQITYFLKIARMANKGLVKKFDIIHHGNAGIEALVQFTNGGTVNGKFQFKTADVQTRTGIEKKIQELKIQFLS